MKSGIYKIINTITDDIYIGSSNNIPVRFSYHRRKIKNKNHSNHLIREHSLIYTPETFQLALIEKCDTKNLYEREQYYIEQLRPYYNNILRKPYERKNSGRIILDNTPMFHSEIKAKAALKGMTMKDYINMAILEKMKRDKQYE